MIDSRAFWPFWFEHHREAMLERVLARRRGTARLAPVCSSWFYATDAVLSQARPLTGEDRLLVVFSALAEALEDESPWVRDAACLTLGKLGDPEVGAALGCLVDPAGLPRLPRLFENLHYRAEVRVVRDALRNL